MLVFSTGFVNYCPSNLGWQLLVLSITPNTRGLHGILD
jgi:hypothetical protein